MSYIEKNLEDGEQILAKAHIHWWFNLKGFGLPNAFNQLWITDRRMLQKSGILSARTQSINLGNLEAKDVEQSLWGRMFGFGDLLVYGTGGQAFRFENITNPSEISRTIGKAAAAYSKTRKGFAEAGVSGKGKATTGDVRQ